MINDTYSAPKLNKYGVPQGSVLGPLLFIIYINDIIQTTNHSFLNLFADDTLLAVSDKDLNSAIERINMELQSIEHYLAINKLKLNTSKCKAMILTRQKQKHIDNNSVNIILNNAKLEIVNEIKYLGLILDNTLSFKNHYTYIKKNISKNYIFSRESRLI